MKTYEYTGDVEITLNGVGRVKAGDTITVEAEINHPLFTEVVKSKSQEKREKTMKEDKE